MKKTYCKDCRFFYVKRVTAGELLLCVHFLNSRRIKSVKVCPLKQHYDGYDVQVECNGQTLICFHHV